MYYVDVVRNLLLSANFGNNLEYVVEMRHLVYKVKIFYKCPISETALRKYGVTRNEYQELYFSCVGLATDQRWTIRLERVLCHGNGDSGKVRDTVEVGVSTLRKVENT